MLPVCTLSRPHFPSHHHWGRDVPTPIRIVLVWEIDAALEDRANQDSTFTDGPPPFLAFAIFCEISASCIAAASLFFLRRRRRFCVLLHQQGNAGLGLIVQRHVDGVQ